MIIKGRFLFKYLTAVGILCSPSFVLKAENYDFSNYKGTLTKLYDGSSISIKSGYKITFSPVTSGGIFTYYSYDGVTVTPAEYYISTSPDTAFGMTTSRTVNDSEHINITSNYYVTSASSNGGALYNKGDGEREEGADARGHIINLVGDFYGTTYEIWGTGGGAAIANNGIIENMTGDFVDNKVDGEYRNATNTYGGAILNGVKPTNALNYIGTLRGNFINNGVLNGQGGVAGGGAIANFRGINSISGHFIANYAVVKTQPPGGAFGGAIYNMSGIINSISGNFIANSSDTPSMGGGTSAGGAIGNFATIGQINGVFNGNWTSGSMQAFGGGIYNQKTIGNIKGTFIGNNALNFGGGISNFSDGVSTIDFSVGVGDWNNANNNNPMPLSSITGGFSRAALGATIDSIDGDFIANYAGDKGGAIHNQSDAFGIAYIGSISGNFKENYLKSAEDAKGGAIYNGGVIDSISANFTGNYAETSAANGLALGGAIYTDNSLKFLADGKKMSFSGNHTIDSTYGTVYNAIFVDTKSALHVLDFTMQNGGSITMDDNISGAETAGTTLIYANQYGINITGDSVADEGESKSKMTVKNDIINAGAIKVKDAALIMEAGTYGKGTILANAAGTAAPVTNLGLDNAVFHTANKYEERIDLKSYSAAGNSFWHLDVNPDTMSADTLHVQGDVTGQTQLVIHATSDKDITNQGEIPFAYSYNDTTGNANSFTIFRVHTSPYLYDVVYHENQLDREWALVMNGKKNPPDPDGGDDGDKGDGGDKDGDGGDGGNVVDPDVPSVVVPEAVAFMGLHAAAFEQTRNLIQNVSNQVAMGKVYVPGTCYLVEEKYDSERLYNAWIRPTYYNSDIKKPLRIDASVAGVDGGFDSQLNEHHKAGLFLSYRNGSYDLDGKADKYYSTVASKIDMDSYLSGLYYRYDKNCMWAFMTVFTGWHDAKFKTSDGVSAKTDGVQFGFGAEAGFFQPLGKDRSWVLEPSLAVNYSQVDFDAVSDPYGKTAYYDLLRQVEVELSAKLEKTFTSFQHGKAKAYIKPSLVRPFSSGDKVHITNLGAIDTYHDTLMGRVEAGAKYNLTSRTHIYSTVNYTFSSKYDAFSANIGFTYTFGK